jgi:hypothetical protein
MSPPGAHPYRRLRLLTLALTLVGTIMILFIVVLALQAL